MGSKSSKFKTDLSPPPDTDPYKGPAFEAKWVSATISQKSKAKGVFRPRIESEVTSLGPEAALAQEISEKWRVAAVVFAPDGLTMSRGVRTSEVSLTLEVLLVSGADDTVLPGGDLAIGHTSMDMAYKRTGIFKPTVAIESDAPQVLTQLVAQTEGGAALRGVLPMMGAEGTVGARSGEMVVPLDAWYVAREGQSSGWEHALTQLELTLKYSTTGKVKVEGDTSDEHFAAMSAEGWRLHGVLPSPATMATGRTVPYPINFFWSRPIESPPALEPFVGAIVVKTKASMSGKMSASTDEYHAPIAELASQGWIMGALAAWPGHKVSGATVTQTHKAFFQRVRQ